MDLAAFMERVGAKPAQVARATGLHAATIIRIRDREQVPDGPTLLRISAWADEAADALKLRADERLSWQYLLADDEGKDSAAAGGR